MDDYKTGHRERLRARAENSGIESLRSFEILELLLCYAVPRVDMSEPARLLIGRFGSLKNVLAASPEELTSVPGIGKSAAQWLSVAGELVSAYTAVNPVNQPKIDRHRDAIEYISSFSRYISPPCSIIIFTDFSNRVIMKSIICDSTSWSHAQYIRRIITQAIALQAKHAFLVILSGTSPVEYEEADIMDLLDFARSLWAIDVELLDCIHIWESGIKSLNACGAMDIIREESKKRLLHEDYCSD